MPAGPGADTLGGSDAAGEETMDDLSMRFPDVDPRRQSPILFRINGFGFGLYGRRSHDPETGTYVKRHCFCALWIPLIPIASYRVADADRGWYVLGRLQLSPLERAVRGAVALAAVALVGTLAWSAYTNTEGYRNRAAWANVESAIEEGDLGTAATRLRRLTRSNGTLRPRARETLAALVEDVGPATPAADAQAVFEAAANPKDGDGAVRDDVWERVVAYAGARSPATARERVETLEACEHLAPTVQDFRTARRAHVEAAASEAPSDVWAACELASYLEEDGDLERCEQILAPHAGSLGTTEGARVLGQVYAATGRYDEAFALLERYVSKRLVVYRTSEEELRVRYERVQKDALGRLDRGAAPDAWYERYDAASETDQIAMVQQWIDDAASADPGLVAARDAFGKAVTVVPVAMDLGIVRLQRARAMTDETAAQEELRKVETLFDAIHGVARDDPNYLLTAARVAFWLGKPDECNALLEEAVATGRRSFETRMAVGTVLHTLGESATACEHWEKAYERASDDEQRGQAAAAIAAVTCSTDPREAVTWYERIPTPSPPVVAQLAAARADVALLDGDTDKAIEELRRSLALYADIPEDSTTLNNAALAARQLSALTGDVGELQDAARRLRKAVASDPTDVVLMGNTARALIHLARVSVLDGPVDATQDPSVLAAFEYDAAAGRDALARRLAEREESRQAAQLLDRCLALTERNATVILTRMELAGAVRDVETLERLAAHVRAHAPDYERALQGYRATLLSTQDDDATLAALERCRARVRSLADDAPAKMRAAARVQEIVMATSCVLEGVEGGIDLDELDRRTQEVAAALPCSGTRWARRTVASAALHRRLAAEDERYAEVAGRLIRFVPPALLALEAFHRDASLAERMRGTPEMGAVLDVLQESAQRFPDELGAVEWAYLRLGTPEQAALAERSKPDPEQRSMAEIRATCSPFVASAALQWAWELRRAGEDERAEAVLEECRRHGSLVPFLR